MQLLEEVRKLREQLNQSIQSNSALAHQLQSRLNESHSSNTPLHYSMHASPSSVPAATQTSTKRSTSKGTTSSRVPVLDKSTGTHVPTSHRSTHTSTHRSTEHTSSTSLHDTSASSLSQQDYSSSSGVPPRSGDRVSVKTTTVLFTPPKDTSTPQSGLRSSRATSERLNRTTRISQGVNTDGALPRSQSDEFVRAGRVPKLDSSSSSSFYSHSSSTRVHDSTLGGGEGGRRGGTKDWRRPTGAESAARRTTGPFSASGLSSREFESLETRLQQALDSSSLQVCIQHTHTHTMQSVSCKI